jgi:hypothetical protein
MGLALAMQQKDSELSVYARENRGPLILG